MDDPGRFLTTHHPPGDLVDAALVRRAQRGQRRVFAMSALALAAGVTLGLVVGELTREDPVAPEPAFAHMAPPEGQVPVRFELAVRDAGEVTVAGSFNGWNPEALPMEQLKDGVFAITVALPPGRHEYMFVVDGEWVTDPDAALTADDGFGRSNAILEI